MSASTPPERQRRERLAAAIQRTVDAAPALSAEQVGQLRGLLPYPHSGASAPPSSRESSVFGSETVQRQSSGAANP